MTSNELLNDELLQADLVVYKGNNKARLVARCYVALMQRTPGRLEASKPYEAFRDEWTKKSFDKIHTAFDHILPAEYTLKQVNKYGTGGRGRQAKQANGLSPAQQKKLESFLKCPPRLERRFMKTVDYYQSVCDESADRRDLPALIKRYADAAEACREMTQETLLGLWNLGMRGSGELERMIEKTYGI